MKKIALYLFSMTVLLTSLTGCGKDNKEPVTIQTSNEETIKNTKETGNTSDKDDKQEEYFLGIDATDVNMMASDEEHDRYGIVEVSYTKFELDEATSEKYPQLAKTLSDMSERYDTDKAEEVKTLKESYLEWEKEGENYITYEDSLKSKAIRADNTVLSILNNSYTFQGGAHGYYMIYGDAYDVVTGQQLFLRDIITDESAFIAKIKEKVLEKYQDGNFLVDIDEYFSTKSISNGDEFVWSMDYSGITIYFEPYEIASYAAGILTVRLSFAEEGALINEKYTNVPDNYVTPVTTWTEAYADLDGDGEEDEISLYAETMDDELEPYRWHLKLDSACWGFNNSYNKEGYLVKKNDDFYVYLFETSGEGYNGLIIVEANGYKKMGDDDTKEMSSLISSTFALSNFQELNYGLSNYGIYDKEYGYVDNVEWETTSVFTDPNNFMMDSCFKLLGTYYGVRNYHISKDGLPASDEEFYLVDRVKYLIAPTEDVKCKLIDKEGNVLEDNATIPKDTKLRIVRTNGKNIVDLQAADFIILDGGYEDNPDWIIDTPLDMETGKFYRIECELKEEGIFTSGYNILELFKGMNFY